MLLYVLWINSKLSIASQYDQQSMRKLDWRFFIYSDRLLVLNQHHCWLIALFICLGIFTMKVNKSKFEIFNRAFSWFTDQAVLLSKALVNSLDITDKLFDMGHMIWCISYASCDMDTVTGSKSKKVNNFALDWWISILYLYVERTRVLFNFYRKNMPSF